MTDDNARLRAEVTALTGVVMAMLTRLHETGSPDLGEISRVAENYVSSKAPEGSPEHQHGLDFIRVTLLSRWKEHP